MRIKRKIRKLLALAIAAAAVLSAGSCGAKPTGGETSKFGETSEFKVGAIYFNSKDDAAGYTYAHHRGITAAMEELGMDVDAQLAVMDNVPEEYDAVTDAIETLVKENCRIIFGISFGYMQPMADMAAVYPEVVFSHGTGYQKNDTNFNNYFGRIYQARYLTGVAAGLKSLETGADSIGYVSAFGTGYAETCSGINSFALGVQAANPDAVVYVKELGNWADEEKETACAQELIQDYGCAVIAQHCDSARPQIAAEQAGVFGCGYNSDMSEDAPHAHLTAAVWNWKVYYRAAIETAMTCGKASDFVGAMGGAVYYGGLKEGIVDISPLSGNCAPGTQDAVDRVRELIVSGEWDVFSGVKLRVSVTGGKASVERLDEALRDDGGNEIAAAGSPPIEDSVITGTMYYFVEGVVRA